MSWSTANHPSSDHDPLRRSTSVKARSRTRSHLTTSRKGRLVRALKSALTATAILCGVSAASGATPGWAPGGDPKIANSQYTADAKSAATSTECGSNAIVLFRVRGSGESYGGDSLGFWTYVAGTKLTKTGWRVRDLQARYTAPAVPVARALAHLAYRDLAGVYFTARSYRDAASRQWPGVRNDLVAVARRCPARKIAIAGYSQGGIVLRYVMPRLPADVQKQIVSIDLVADPTADASVDGSMTVRAGDSDSRRTQQGIDTFGAKGVNPWFHQTGYPSALTRRTVIYCMRNDLVCDARPATVSSPNNWLNVVRIHTGYSWGAIGAAAAKRIGSAPAPAITYPGASGSSAAAPGASASPAAPSTPAPAPTWSETTGGAANTWTNYTNAGGTQGPTIAARATVQIACKITGFRVADGNTWWYRIASSPWDGRFYVSADAFYNNGATSGSLSGTPFVDARVPNC